MSYKHIYLFIFFLFNTAFCQSFRSEHVFHSGILQEDRSYQVFLPQSYSWAEDRKYPVLFLLDGESHFLHTSGSVSFLSAQGEIPEMIIVAVTSTIRIRDYTQTDWAEAWVGGGGAENFKDFLAKELIPEIEKDYRTSGYRILSGHSAAGQFALFVLSSQPSLFNAYFAVSPSLYWDHNLPRRSLEDSFKKTDTLKSFLYFAWSDDMGQALEDDKKLAETLVQYSPEKFRWSARAFPGETHGSIMLLAQIDAMRQLFDGYRFHNDNLSRGIEFAKEHFRNVSEKTGYEIPVPEDVLNSLGYEALNKGNISEAIALFKSSTEQNPNSANAFDSLTDAYQEAGMWDEALKSVEKAVELAEKFNSPNREYFKRHAKQVREKSGM